MLAEIEPNVDDAAAQLENLIATVGATSNPWGATNSLGTKLRHALKGVNGGSAMTACNSPNAFADEALALAGNKPTLGQASLLIDSAKRIEAVLACP